MTKKSDSVTFEAAGKAWTARMVPSAWIELEDAGLGAVQEVAAKLQASASFRTLRRIMLAALRHKHPDVTEESVAAMADEMGSEALLKVVGDAIKASFPDQPKEGNGDSRTTGPAGTGISS